MNEFIKIAINVIINKFLFILDLLFDFINLTIFNIIIDKIIFVADETNAATTCKTFV
jgi:hypothetical protein